MAQLIAYVLLLCAILIIALYTPYPQSWMRWAVPVIIVVALVLYIIPGAAVR
jgi:hypothetical protein